jgi:hypothetical protein
LGKVLLVVLDRLYLLQIMTMLLAEVEVQVQLVLQVFLVNQGQGA